MIIAFVGHVLVTLFPVSEIALAFLKRSRGGQARSEGGLLLAFVGLGISFGSWLSILALMLPICFAVLNRVRKEEHALIAALGSEYAEYCSRTKRFIPGLL